MELNPILAKGDCAKPNLWYVVSPTGEGPSVRVGSCCSVAMNHGKCGKVYVTGGANPDGPFAEVFCLDLEKFSWDKMKFAGFKARYEHAAFIPESNPNSIVIFGGAEQNSNLNDVQILDLDAETCSTVEVQGEYPSPRTCHAMAAIKDKLYVFGGGESGAVAVSDSKLHVFDTDNKSWQSLSTHGRAPSTRHGHVLVSIGSVLYVHGGMDGAVLMSDLYSFNAEESKWSLLKPTGCVPCARAAHSGVAVNHNMYIFGGMTPTGALCDLFCLNTESLTWTQIEYSSAAPSCRLDHGMCVIDIPQEDKDEDSETHQPGTQKLLFVFGGMDTRGEIFNDCLVFRIE